MCSIYRTANQTIFYRTNVKALQNNTKRIILSSTTSCVCFLSPHFSAFCFSFFSLSFSSNLTFAWPLRNITEARNIRKNVNDWQNQWINSRNMNRTYAYWLRAFIFSIPMTHTKILNMIEMFQGTSNMCVYFLLLFHFHILATCVSLYVSFDMSIITKYK